MRWASLAALFLATSAQADMLRVEGKVLTDGDPPGKARQLLGTPDQITRLESVYGGIEGERWDYYRDGKTIEVTVRGGRIERIHETR